ncbi:MAG: hypothetical protein V1755_14675 [Chloroflexota bacterium]
MNLLRFRDLLFVVPIAVVLGAGLASVQPGSFWIGWVGFAILLTLGLIALTAAVRWAGGGRTLALMSALALGLRLLAGTVLYLVLPLDGYDEPDDRAGHVFTDAHRRDDQAWDLASSAAPLWSAFDRSYYTDQYGGLLALSAFTYRVFSPDAHRQLLILSLAALVASLGVPFFFRAASRMGDGNLGAAATWLYSLYPESVLTGGAQMREPFLLTLIAVAGWGFAIWLEGRQRISWLWLGIGFGGLMLVSPGIALALLVLLAIWLGIRREHMRAAMPIWIGGVVLFLAAMLFLAWSVRSSGQGTGTPVGAIASWFRDSVAWVIYQLERGSGQVQNVFSKLFPAAQFLFVVAYGVTQPLLPPAFLEPTTLTWHLIGILRSAGWYGLLPLLAYSPVAIRRLPAGTNRRVWTWLAAFNWLWILLCAVRAGGDQWDNPRYRLIFFGIQAIVASAAWLWWRSARDPWLPRILAAEAVCLLLFTQWYLARYYLIGIHFPIMIVMGMSVAGVLIIMLGGAIWDWRRLHRRMD